jgi:hypothetical protein
MDNSSNINPKSSELDEIPQTFRQKLESGETKEQLMTYYCMTEKEYERTILSLDIIKNETPIPYKQVASQEEIDRLERGE